MRNGIESEGYLPPQEQLIIASKVNRLCDASPETFDPKTQVTDAQDIIRALHSKIKPSRFINARYFSTRSSTSEVRAGATNAGNVSTSFKETKTNKISF